MVGLHEEDVGLFYVQITHYGVHVLVYLFGLVENGYFGHCALLPSLAQFACCDDGYGLCFPDAVVFHKFANGHLPQHSEIVLVVVEQAFHQVNGCFLAVAGADEDS